MPTLATNGRIIAARLTASTALDRAAHLAAADRARIHLDLLNVSSAVAEHRLSEADALAEFDRIRDRIRGRLVVTE